MANKQHFENKPSNILAFENQEERDQLSDEMISLRFLGQVKNIMDSKFISKKDLADKLKTSPSYVTQLFQGDKLINVRLLTKIRRILGVHIDITCRLIDEPLALPSKAIELGQLTLPAANVTLSTFENWTKEALTVMIDEKNPRPTSMSINMDSFIVSTIAYSNNESATYAIELDEHN